MNETLLELKEIYALAVRCLRDNGADSVNAEALAETMMAAERDGSHSHGLFRLPAYVAALRSGKMRGDARPTLRRVSSALIRVDGGGGAAPLAHKVGLPALAEAAGEEGVAVLALVRVHHMAALWPEVEYLAQRGLAGFACTTYMPAVAPAGARRKLFGTNPVAFAWPRPGRAPMVFDMATAARAMGDVQMAAKRGEALAPGTGLDAEGMPTTDAARVAGGGMLLPFGGYKGSAIAMMVELLTAGLLHEHFSFEAGEADNGDGGPPRGGQFVLALAPEVVADGGDWGAHCEAFFARFEALEGARLPGRRRHENRLDESPRAIDAALLARIRALLRD